jgi:Undecaprenyl-phosphate glucose phosphotransferase
LKRYHQNIGGIFRLVDALVIGITWLISYYIRFYIPIIDVTRGFPSFESYAALTPLIIGLWVIVFSGLEVYQSRKMLRRTQEAHLIIKSHVAALLIFIAITYLFSEYRYSRVVMVYFGLLGCFFLVFFRLAIRNALRALRKNGFHQRRVLIIGEGEWVETVIHKLNRFPELGFQVVGVLVNAPSQSTLVGGKEVLGHFMDVGKIVKSHQIEQIFIALPRSESSELDHILNAIKDEPVDIQLVPFVMDFITLGCEVEDFDGIPLVSLNDSPLYGWGAFLKRITDVLFSILLIIVLSPILLILGIFVRLSSKGPIFFTQERMGLDGQTFQMYKFRSMKMDAETKSGAVWATENDSRRTWFGMFLRTTSLDELPQLWNVLKGNMTLVGPRPERPVFVEQFKREIPNYMLRHKVKAGMTGWAQVNGWRGNTSLRKRIEFDLYYIKHWSYLFDLKILLLTLWRGFINKNAY